MLQTINTITDVLSQLEDLQRQAGQLQLYLLDVVTDDEHDEWDEPAQAALLKLETVQRRSKLALPSLPIALRHLLIGFNFC